MPLQNMRRLRKKTRSPKQSKSRMSSTRLQSQEADAVAEYEKTTQENKVTKTIKEQDVKYKTAEFKGLDKDISELSSDRETSGTELSAVMDYDGKIKERCIAKPETYEERKKRRTAEIAGLKEALSILNGEALVQRKKHE